MIDNRNQIKQSPGQHSTENFFLFPPRTCSGPGCSGLGGPGPWRGPGPWGGSGPWGGPGPWGGSGPWRGPHPCKGIGCRGNRW